MADPRQRRRYGASLGGALVAILLVFCFVWFVRTMMASKTGKPERRVQNIQLIRPPPPPPPPPDQPPPPPQKTQEALPKDEPEPVPKDESPPPSQPLGIDAEGSAGGDAFGLEARAGGSDLIGGTGNSIFGWYTSRLKDAVIERLNGDRNIGTKKFSVSVRVWIEADGRIKEVKLVTSTGNRDLDQRIENALGSMARLSDAPPLEMPQPISLKIASHG